MNVVNDQYNGVQVIMNEDGKYGVQETLGGILGNETYRYRSLESAERIAQSMSDENDRIDAYEASVK